MPVYDPDRIAPPTWVELNAEAVFDLANAALRHEITAEEWEVAVKELLGEK